MTFDRLILILLFLFFYSFSFWRNDATEERNHTLAATFGWIKAGKAARLRALGHAMHTPNR